THPGTLTSTRRCGVEATVASQAGVEAVFTRASGTLAHVSTGKGATEGGNVPGIIAGVTMGILILFLLFALAGYFYRKHKRRLAAAKREWLVDDRDVKRRRAKLPLSNAVTSSNSWGAGRNMETVKRASSEWEPEDVYRTSLKNPRGKSRRKQEPIKEEFLEGSGSNSSYPV
ncbi:hypothetical protein RRG08_005101, partial [Elysia crispata]